MKGVLIYNLSDFDERQAHLRATKALDLVLTLRMISETLRSYDKYEPDKHFTREDFVDILDKYSIDLDELSI